MNIDIPEGANIQIIVCRAAPLALTDGRGGVEVGDDSAVLKFGHEMLLILGQRDC